MKKNEILENELKKISNEIDLINIDKENLIYKKERVKKTIKLLIIVWSTFILTILIPMAITGLHLSALVGIITSTSLYGIYGSIQNNKLNTIKRHIEELNDEIKYLNEIKEDIETKNEPNYTISVKKINIKYNWEKTLKLMKVYNTYKKSFTKHLKKGDLYELLQDSGYNNQDVYYLYNRTKDEFNEKQNQKVLKK